MSCKKICVICNICEIPARIGQKSVEICEICGTNKQQRRKIWLCLRNLRDQTPAQIGLQEKKIPRDYLLCLSLQKKCHTLKNGSLKASAGKYLTSLISLYTLKDYAPALISQTDSFHHAFRSFRLPAPHSAQTYHTSHSEEQ